MGKGARNRRIRKAAWTRKINASVGTSNTSVKSIARLMRKLKVYE